MNKNSIIINENIYVDDIYNFKNKNRLNFKGLGYDNIILKGPFTQESIIDISIPKSKEVKEGSKINLNIRYGENLDFERSLVTIYVNNIRIVSKKLTKENTNNDTIELNLPKETLNQNCI